MKQWVLVAVLALFAEAVGAQQQLPPGGKEYQEGEAAIKKGDMDGAITAFEAAIGQNPDLFASHYYLGFAYQGKRNFDKAGEHFVKFLEKVPSDPKAAEMINNATRQAGLALARTNKAQEAVPYLSKAVTAKPNDAEVLFYLGVCQMTTGDEASAETNFAKVIQLQPSLSPSYYYAGRISFNKEDWATARERLEKYISIKPDDTFAGEAHFMLGSMAVREAEGAANAPEVQARAKAHLEQFLQLKPAAPQAPQAHYILGSLAAQGGDNETARLHFEKYLELEPAGPQAEEVKKFLDELKKQA